MSITMPTSSELLVYVVFVVRTDAGRTVGEVGSLGIAENAEAIDDRDGEATEDRDGDATEERDGDAVDDQEAAVDARVRPGRLMDSWEMVSGGRIGA